MQRSTRIILAGAAALALLAPAFVPDNHAADSKPKYTIKEAMKLGHKAPKDVDPVCKKASNGQATKEELALLVDLYTAMAADKPEQGDLALWKEKTSTLLAASISLQKGEPGSVEKYKAAVNCKACHETFKPRH